MLRNKSKKMAAALLAALMLVSVQFNVFAADASLTILHVNDRHGRMEAEPYVSQMAKDIAAGGGSVLILDAGDTLHGQTPTNLTKGEVMVSLMNTVGYGAMVPGNHDFNFGVDRLKELSKTMKFPLLSANVKTADGDNLFEPYKVFDFNGVKVGVFGISSPETVSKSDPRIVAGLTFEDPAQAAEKMVIALKAEGCDVIIALTHLGVDAASAAKDRSDALNKVDGIDIIVDGHSHTLLETGKTAGNADKTVTAQTGSFAENIGVIEVVVSDDGITKTAKTVAVPKADDEKPAIAADAAIVSQIEAEKAKIEPITGVVVGNSPVLLQGEREFVRTVETNLANVVSDSMKYATNADIAFLTGGNIRASIEAGDITMGQALTTLPFSNLLATVDLSGADVLKVLEHGVAKYPEASGDHIQVSGIKFEYDPNAEPGSRVTSVLMADGSAFDEKGTYTVCTIDFIIAGGDGYEMMKNGKNMTYYGGDVEAFAAYLGTKPAISAEPEGRVTPIESAASAPAEAAEPAPVPAPVPAAVPSPVQSVTVESAPVSAGVYIVQPGDNLTKIAEQYGLHWRDVFNANKEVIKGDPNLIYPGQQLVIPPHTAANAA